MRFFATLTNDITTMSVILNEVKNPELSGLINISGLFASLTNDIATCCL